MTERDRRRAVLVVALVVLTAFELLGTVGASRHEHPSRDIDVFGLVLVMLGPLGLWWLSRRTAQVVAFEVAVLLLCLGRGYVYGPAVVAPAIALFAAVVLGNRVAAWLGFGVLYGGHLAARVLILDENVSWAELLGVAAWGMVLLFVAELARVRRERMAARFAARREARRREANEERLRIARELHDVVAHHMSLINVQASVALHLVDRSPEQVQTALEVIKDASKEALAEMRSLVGVLRDETEGAPRAPVAMLDSLDDLVQRSALAGLDLRVKTCGALSGLPTAVELAAYRIVQEAVTNVVRHSGARIAEITLRRGAEELQVQVDDDGGGMSGLAAGSLPADSTGSGLRGMEERALALGGTLSVHHSALGGVHIEAVMPLELDR